MSLRNLLYDDRYFADRYYYDRYYSGERYHYPNDRYYWDRYYWRDWHRYYPRHYWNYWTDKKEEKKTDNSDTLRFNRHLENPPTRVYYPLTAPYTPPLWTAPVGVPPEVRLERVPLRRSNSYVSVTTETKDETKVDDKVVESKTESVQEEDDGKSIRSKVVSKSMSNMGGSEIKPVINSVTYVYDADKDKHRHVTYVKHTSNNGDSLPGSLFRSSCSFLPVTRSVGCGPIFNGTSFGILSEHLTIRDTFHVAFQFKTTQQNGVLMSIVDRATGDSFFIELVDSQLKATLFVDGEADSCWTDFDTAVLSNDIWSDVEVNIINNRMSMTVRNQVFTKTHRFPFRRPIRGDLFVAGYPSHATPPFCCRSKDFFVGEMRNFFLNNDGVKWYGAASSYVWPRYRNWFPY